MLIFIPASGKNPVAQDFSLSCSTACATTSMDHVFFITIPLFLGDTGGGLAVNLPVTRLFVKLAVKAVDIFGNDTMKVIEVSV